MAKIEPGFYYIRNLASEKYIGRLLDEDRSLSPKRVVNLPQQAAGQTRFLLEKTSDEKYKITVNGGRMISADRNLFAALSPEPYPDQKWTFVHDERTGTRNFVIMDSEKGFEKAWTVKDLADFAQVNVDLVPVGRSIPPYYPPNAVWTLEYTGD